MSTSKPSPLAAAEWCTVPFEGQSKTPPDELVDLLLQLPACLAIFNEIQQAKAESGDVPGLRRDLINGICSLLKGLEMFAERHTSFMSVASEDMGNATFIAFYHSAKVACLRYHAGATRSGCLRTPQMDISCEMILRCASIHGSRGVYSGGSYAMIFPLKLASIAATSPEIRNRAQIVISTWARERGVRLISAHSSL